MKKEGKKRRGKKEGGNFCLGELQKNVKSSHSKLVHFPLTIFDFFFRERGYEALGLVPLSPQTRPLLSNDYF